MITVNLSYTLYKIINKLIKFILKIYKYYEIFKIIEFIVNFDYHIPLGFIFTIK